MRNVHPHESIAGSCPVGFHGCSTAVLETMGKVLNRVTGNRNSHSACYPAPLRLYFMAHSSKEIHFKFPFPDLPQDIGRIIFEIAASLDSQTGASCALVSKKVKTWCVSTVRSGLKISINDFQMRQGGNRALSLHSNQAQKEPRVPLSHYTRPNFD